MCKQKYNEGENLEESAKKDVHNHILLTKRPYFFKYLYNDAKRAYSKFVERHEITCTQKFNMSIAKLKSLPRKTPEQTKYLKNFYGYMPLTYSDSSMNLVCRYIEDVNFNIKSRIKSATQEDVYALYKNNKYEYTQEQYEKVVVAIKQYTKAISMQTALILSDKYIQNGDMDYTNISSEVTNIKKIFNEVCSNPWVLVNCLVDYYYIESPSAKRDIMLMAYGDYIYKNIVENSGGRITFPMPDMNGNIEYLGKNYRRNEVVL